MLRKVFLFVVILFFMNTVIKAQDFGFGFDDDEDSKSSSVSFKADGEVSVEATPFIYDFMESESYDNSLWNVKLNLTFSSPYIDVFSSFNFNSSSINELWLGSSDLKELNYTPLIIDEFFFRAYISKVNIEAGFRKLTWGKADSNGPLDVINPIDYTDLRNIEDIKANKIARPMVHITWNTGDFSKLEGVFIPNFTGHRFASKGRWAPSQYTDMFEKFTGTISSMTFQELVNLVGITSALGMADKLGSSGFPDNYSFEFPDTSGIEYFQTGLRFTATIKSVDLGLQYFYGNLFRPNICLTKDSIDNFIMDLLYNNMPPYYIPGSYPGDLSLLDLQIKYTRYHQIGIDYAQVLLGFNLRAEAAINITEDINGDDGSFQNPFLAWSFGFDRNLFWGINANIQCNETVRLLDDKVGENPVLDSQADTDVTSTRISMRVSKSFFRDKFENSIMCIWDVENSDFFIIPSIAWTEGNMTTKLSAGIFTGKENGELGQYWENTFIKFALSFMF
jgi:hypothetical protein